MGSKLLHNSDEQLFSLIAEGDEAAFEQLFYRYLPKLQMAVRKIVKEEAVVNDIIQEVFLHLWIGRDKLPEVQSPANWIFRIMYNRALTSEERRISREARHKAMSGVAAGDYTNETEEAIYLSDLTRLVQEAIQKMPAQTQKIYQLSRDTGLKIPEIATQLNLSPNTVKNTLVRGGKFIRDHLADNGIVLPLILFIYC